jgi:hypothetical protein
MQVLDICPSIPYQNLPPTPSMAELKPYKQGYYLWSYVPSLGAAIIFLMFFGIATIMHIYRLIKTRTWFCLPFAVGGFCMFTPSTRYTLSFEMLTFAKLSFTALVEDALHITIPHLYFPMRCRIMASFSLPSYSPPRFIWSWVASSAQFAANDSPLSE